MATKRSRNEFENHTSGFGKRASFSFAAVIHQVMVANSKEKQLAAAIEPMIRRVIREEVDSVCSRILNFLQPLLGQPQPQPQAPQSQPQPRPQMQPQPQQPQPHQQLHDLQVIQAKASQILLSLLSQSTLFQPQTQPQPYDREITKASTGGEASPTLLSLSRSTHHQPQLQLQIQSHPHDLQVKENMLCLNRPPQQLQSQSKPLDLEIIEASRCREASLQLLSPSSCSTLSMPQPQLQPHSQANTSRSRSTLRLAFVRNPPKDIFTFAKVLDVDGNPLQLELVGEASTDGGELLDYSKLPALKIELLIVDGDFPGSGKEEWTTMEFNRSVLRERKGRRPLIIDDVNVVMRDTKRVFLNELAITDNSSWTRSRNFRIAARVTPECCEAVGFEIKEAITEKFVVKDRRGEVYKKSNCPALSDEVWRLKNISKNGKFHERLSQNLINSVHDFLEQYAIDPARLRTVLGQGMTEKMWLATVYHAKTCNDAQSILLRNPVDGNGYAAGDSHVNNITVNDAQTTTSQNLIGGNECAAVHGNNAYAAADAHFNPYTLIPQQVNTYTLIPQQVNTYNTLIPPQVNTYNSVVPQQVNTAVMAHDINFQEPVSSINMQQSYHDQTTPAVAPSALEEFEFTMGDFNMDTEMQFP